MNNFTSLLVSVIIGFVVGIAVTALKLSNVMNASILDCVTKQVITKDKGL